MIVGVFDSGFGGLSLLKTFQAELPGVNFMYLGDNARAPYGNRDRSEIADFTYQALTYLFSKGCSIIVIACNTASIDAQQYNLRMAEYFPDRTLIEIITPTAEQIGYISSKGVGIVATQVTIDSGIYPRLIKHFFPQLTVVSEACPMWVPLIENNEHLSQEAIGFLRRHIDHIVLNHEVDTILLACTHYGLVARRLQLLYPNFNIIGQGPLIVDKLKNSLPAVSPVGSTSGKGHTIFLTTSRARHFDQVASLFMGVEVNSNLVTLIETHQTTVPL